ncbi:DUF3987 domain-containing protein [Methylovulum psychrotolerans]|uniref:DUF3987 domain-containing protein n=1 Tax=Methylovulum psychrotolerans TaxID=1704499 RepID=UPI001BFEFCAD|nr:DUF3987 domain-containing protein [Methylovulum psychrotolerans]MBT9098765.1 DUF3987 domain-containing protein [Methylovulum psychrotolerans]
MDDARERKRKAAAELAALTNPISQQAAAKVRKKPEPVEDDYIEDTVIAPPQPTEAMFYGFVGELARIAAQGTGLNRVAVSTAFLSFLGANIGRDTFLMVGDTVHHPRLFTLHIGRSGQGGKGDSQQLTHRIRKRIELAHSNLLGQSHSGGLSSREGLAGLIHDGHGENRAIDDKRLWVIESEFANVLHQGRRDGNTLSTALRDAWDGSDIKPATKSRSVASSAPHIGIHANITPSELKGLSSSRDINNGFFNRFLMVFSENVAHVAFPSPTPESVVDDLAAQAADIIRYAKGGYPASVNGLQMHMSEAAREYYKAIYPSLRRPLDSEAISALLERRAPYLLRLAMLFALTNKTHVIEPKHLQAALAWVNYAINTVKYVFADQAVSPLVRENRTHADKILLFLSDRPEGAGLWELNNDCFKKHLSSDKIQKALGYLLSENPPTIEQIEAKKGVNGRPKKAYRIKNGAEKAEKPPSHERRGLELVL